MDNDGTSMSQIYIGIFYSRGTSFFRVVNRNSLSLGLLHFRKYYNTLAKSKGCCPKKARKARTKRSDSTLSNKQTKEPISHRKLKVLSYSDGSCIFFVFTSWYVRCARSISSTCLDAQFSMQDFSFFPREETVKSCTHLQKHLSVIMAIFLPISGTKEEHTWPSS